MIEDWREQAVQLSGLPGFKVIPHHPHGSRDLLPWSLLRPRNDVNLIDCIVFRIQTCGRYPGPVNAGVALRIFPVVDHGASPHMFYSPYP